MPRRYGLTGVLVVGDVVGVQNVFTKVDADVIAQMINRSVLLGGPIELDRYRRGIWLHRFSNYAVRLLRGWRLRRQYCEADAIDWGLRQWLRNLCRLCL